MSRMASPIRTRLRFVVGQTVAMGPGKADLLSAIQELGSIAAAARSMGMSYKRAWYLIDTMNRIFRSPVVEAVKGGRHHGGAELTQMGREVMAAYRSMEARATRAISGDLRAFAKLLKDDSQG